MYDGAGALRPVGRQLEPLPRRDVDPSFPLALTRVRRLVADYVPGMTLDAGRWATALHTLPPEGTTEAEHRFVVGWLAWLAGDWVRAEGCLVQAEQELAATPPVSSSTDTGRSAGNAPLSELSARCAYWLTRLRILMGRSDAIAGYETALRRLAGSPQATAWYVDLLWRAGRFDRAEQVWKSVRGNKRVLACDEGPLLDVRTHLRKGEIGPAERLLLEARPASGVVWVERQLLLAWALVSVRRPEQARATLEQAATGPYPARALEEWRRRIESRLAGTSEFREPATAGWREYVQGQEARRLGQKDRAIELYRQARSVPMVAPYAAFGLACLGTTDPFPTGLGAYYQERADLFRMIHDFRHRQITPTAFLLATERAPHDVPQLSHYRRLAEMLAAPGMSLAESSEKEDLEDLPRRRNTLRVALERCERMSPECALPHVMAWAESNTLPELCGRYLARLALRLATAPALERAARLAPEVITPTMTHLIRGEIPPKDDAPAMILWRRERGEPEARAGRLPLPYESLRRALEIVAAARRGDLAAVESALTDPEPWHAFTGGPPRFLLRALEAAARARPQLPLWQHTLPRWLGSWPGQEVASVAPVLASLGGLAMVGADLSDLDPPWLDHLAARALLRDDAESARTYLRAASEDHLTRATLAAIERRADSQALARCLGYGTAAVFAGLVDLLRAHPWGQALLAAIGSEKTTVLHQMEELLERGDLPLTLQRHLAVMAIRLAMARERTDPRGAVAWWQRGWRLWLSLMGQGGQSNDETRSLLLEHLTSEHRRRVNDHLAREEIESARAHTGLVHELPAIAGASFQAELQTLVERFDDELITESLLAAREAMRFGDIPEGLRGDYERGLRLLSRLDAVLPASGRLQTAMVEICVDWFVDLYHKNDFRQLAQEADRYAGMAHRLEEHLDQGERGGTARPALAEFWKFTGFVAPTRAERLEHYLHAKALDPANDNVRRLLAELESDDE